jgi:hypothetical protein
VNRRRTSISTSEAELMHAFHQAGHQQGRCQECGYAGVFVEVHHVLEQQLLRNRFPRGAMRVGLDTVWAPIGKIEPDPDDESIEIRTQAEIVWDPRGALLLCKEPAPNRCHPRHTLAVKAVSQRALRSENWEFARELGLAWQLEANYSRAAAA